MKTQRGYERVNSWRWSEFCVDHHQPQGAWNRTSASWSSTTRVGGRDDFLIFLSEEQRGEVKRGPAGGRSAAFTSRHPDKRRRRRKVQRVIRAGGGLMLGSRPRLKITSVLTEPPGTRRASCLRLNILQEPTISRPSNTQKKKKKVKRKRRLEPVANEQRLPALVRRGCSQRSEEERERHIKGRTKIKSVIPAARLHRPPRLLLWWQTIAPIGWWCRWLLENS